MKDHRERLDPSGANPVVIAANVIDWKSVL